MAGNGFTWNGRLAWLEFATDSIQYVPNRSETAERKLGRVTGRAGSNLGRVPAQPALDRGPLYAACAMDQHCFT
jgi:hypothetical protein